MRYLEEQKEVNYIVEHRGREVIFFSHFPLGSHEHHLRSSLCAAIMHRSEAEGRKCLSLSSAEHARRSGGSGVGGSIERAERR